MRAVSKVQREGVVAARELAPAYAVSSGWCLDTLAGRFVELTGGPDSAVLTAAMGLVLEVQRRGELAVWVGGQRSTFYPEDAAASGVDLAALPVVRVAEEAQAWQAADTLLHSGAFALVALDLAGPITVPIAMQTRLTGLAKKHHTALVAITRNAAGRAMAGSLVSLRCETAKRRVDHDCFLWELRVTKDKRGMPGWRHSEICRGPDGLC